MSFDKIFDLTAGVYSNFYNIFLNTSGTSSIDLGSIRILCKLCDAQAVLSKGEVLSFASHLKLDHATYSCEIED